MAIGPIDARQKFIQKLEEGIDQELVSCGELEREVFLGIFSNISPEIKMEIGKHYKEKGWEVSFKKKNPLWAWPFFYGGKELWIVLNSRSF